MNTIKHTTLPAILLLAAGVISAIVMLFHPAAEGADTQARMHSLAALSSLSRHVHLAMIAAIIATWLSLACVARVWPASAWIWIAVRLYGVAAGAMLGAALVNGFLLASYLERMLSVTATASDLLPSVMLAFAANQTLAGFGTVLASIAIALWSVAMIGKRGRFSTASGVYGICAGAFCVVAYAAGMFSLDVSGMTAVVVAHGIWYCLLGVCLLRGR